jgi:hypothetical protein
MSWLQNANKDYTIITGDGKKYIVNWLNARVATEFNTAQFNFVNTQGTLVRRSQIMGAVYDIEIYFVGEDNLTRAKDFRDSSANKNAWTVNHPMYGAIYVQPLSLSYDDSSFNTTRITGQIMETNEDRVRDLLTNVSPVDTIQLKKFDTDFAFAQSYAIDVAPPITADVSAMQFNVTTAERLQLAFATISEDAELVRNTYSDVNAQIDNGFANAFSAVAGVQRMLSLPVIFVNSIFNRIDFLQRTAQALYSSITSLKVPHLKKLYENNVSALITSICAASVTNVTATDYPNRNSVVQIITILADTYNDYILNLDTLQTETGDTPDSYIPNFDSLNLLGDIVSYTISNLFIIASNAKQERTLTLSRDNNVINIAFEIYGLLEDDSTITQIVNDNNIGLSEIMQLKKGRKIIYYV